MFRPAVRIALGPSGPLRVLPRVGATRRLISTAPPHQTSRSWKSSAIRWGIAGTLIYYYNTSTAFAEEPAYIHAPPEASRENETYQTVDSISQQRRARLQQQTASSSDRQIQTENVAVVADGEPSPVDSPEGLEEEASQQGAFNEETGEINWDCPCLGGMAHGTCGEQFRAAFSCFVFSKEEPKGVDCIENFKAMQNCFRDHPDEYGTELEDDESPAEHEDGQAQPAPASAHATTSTASSPAESESSRQRSALDGAASEPQKGAESLKSESASAVKEPWHDSREPEKK